ncbi:hypothetical protein XENOCAPTIV_022028, partial [Xenoophorus captivus]
LPELAQIEKIVAANAEILNKFTTRIIVTEGNIRKMTITTRLDTLKDLLGWLKDCLQTNCSFTLQYQDPEFNNEFCNLTHLSELPEKPTIKMIPMVELVPVTIHLDLSSDSVSLADTKILSVSPERSSQWPEEFEIPTFPVDVEYRLCQGNLLYLRDGVCFKVTKELKHDILEKLAESMYSFKAYPTKKELMPT